jgi:bifunctional non-homologous end joining protein LigD
MSALYIDGYEVSITNPEKLLWPELGIRKIDYITKIIELAPYIISHAQNRLLTTIRYPHGYIGKSFYQKNTPKHAPEWIKTYPWHDNNYILPNNSATLVWLANQAALELHTAFNYYTNELRPKDIVFDLDPAEGLRFSNTADVALTIREELKKFDIISYVKMSGATGLQIYISVNERYDYDTARKINHIFALFFANKYPESITMERVIKKRGQRVYFDYLQMWSGKTIISPYSPRATAQATVAVPVEWQELEQGAKPEDFTLLNITERLKEKGDLFLPLLEKGQEQNLDFILEQFA